MSTETQYKNYFENFLTGHINSLIENKFPTQLIFYVIMVHMLGYKLRLKTILSKCL